MTHDDNLCLTVKNPYGKYGSSLSVDTCRESDSQLFNYDVLGVASAAEPGPGAAGAVEDLTFDMFRENLGTLADERWMGLAWRMPEKETSPCWWLTNSCDSDRTQAPKLLCRSLACMRLQVQSDRIATTAKEKAE